MSTAAFQFSPSSKVAGFTETVWQEFSPLSVKYGAVNLGQGFPNWNPARTALDAAIDCLSEDKHGSKIAPFNQYTRSGGHPSLVKALSDLYSPLFDRQLDPNTNILVTCGATEALFAAGQALLDPSDEVILFEPFFDIYGGSPHFAGAKIVPVQLHLRKPPLNDDGSEPELSSSMYQFDIDELTAAFSPRTKMIWINTPHNPTGKMFSLEEMQVIADLVRKHPRCIVLADEVYEWITYDDNKHLKFANLPGMWERTLTVSSAAKTFSLTGWKVGWAVGTPQIISALMRVHEYVVYSIATPLQEALAVAITEAAKSDYFFQLKEAYAKKRQVLISALRKAGLNPIVPQGSFFVTVDSSAIKLGPDQGLETITGTNMDLKDWRVARWLTAHVGVTPIPCSAFYTPSKMSQINILRFAFCKTDDALEEASVRLEKLPQFIADLAK